MTSPVSSTGGSTNPPTLSSASSSSGTSSTGSYISGLISGLHTTSIISSLTKQEAQPQTLLKQKVSTEQTVIAAYQSVNTQMSALGIAASSLTLGTTWQAATATSSSSSVVATASSGALPGSYTFDVTALAQAQTSTFALPSSGNATTGGGINISIGGADPVNYAVATDTPQGVADAINGAKIGLQATVINSDQGPILQVSSTKTGTASGFTITGLNATQNDLVQAANAQLTVGDPNNGGYTVTSSTNTFTNLIKNVTLTATAKQTGVTVNVQSDASGLADKMQALITAANSALTEIGKQTAYTPADSTAGTAGSGSPLLGDLSVQDLQSKILSAVANGTSVPDPNNSGSTLLYSFSQFGVETQSDGSLTFDRNAFIAAFQANPSQVQSVVQTSLAKTLNDVANGATDVATGSLTTAIQGGNSLVKELNSQISDWTLRLQDKQTQLQQQFTAMEVSLGQLKDQGDWLAGQISSLPTASSGK